MLFEVIGPILICLVFFVLYYGYAISLKSFSFTWALLITLLFGSLTYSWITTGQILKAMANAGHESILFPIYVHLIYFMVFFLAFCILLAIVFDAKDLNTFFVPLFLAVVVSLLIVTILMLSMSISPLLFSLPLILVSAFWFILIILF